MQKGVDRRTRDPFRIAITLFKINLTYPMFYKLGILRKQLKVSEKGRSLQGAATQLFAKTRKAFGGNDRDQVSIQKAVPVSLKDMLSDRKDKSRITSATKIRERLKQILRQLHHIPTSFSLQV